MLEEFRITGLRIEHLRDQLDAATIECEAALRSAGNETEAAAAIARSQVLVARREALTKLVDDVRRQRIQFQNAE